MDARAAREDFRRELRDAGTPLVEPIPDSDSEVLVTFLWFAEQSRRNVVVQSWLESRSVEKRAMKQIGDSGVWYRSFRAPSDLTMGYLLSPDDARILPGEPGDVTSTWVADPLNPKRARGALGLNWSVVNLSGHTIDRWMTDPGSQVPARRLSSLRIVSDELGYEVPITVQVPAGFEESGSREYPLILYLDEFGFFEIDRAHRLIEWLVARGRIRPVVVAFIYNSDATRNRDMSCYPPTHRFLKSELVPILRERFRAGLKPEGTLIAGRSRSGLGAVCAAYEMPEVIGNAISQSGAFWWAPDGEELEWLARDMASTTRRDVTLYLDAGDLEDGPNPETSLSMLTVTRHLRDVAVAKGYRIHYREFPGGHDPIGW